MSERTVTPEELGIPGAIPLPERTDWRIGMIGFGGIARAHVAAYHAAGWKIVAVADPDEGARARAKEACGGPKLYEDYRDLVADEAVEVISLLTHPTLREPVVEAAASAKKPLLTEKPFSTEIARCEHMVAVAAEGGIPLAVSQNQRWAPGNFWARHIIEKGLIGRPYYASIEIQGTQDEKLSDHPFYSKCGDFLTIQWNNHLADLLRYWTGRDARRVLTMTRRMNGQEFVSDNLLISVADFGEGVTGHIVHSELLRSDLRASACRVDGDAGSILFDYHSEELVLHSRELGGDPVRLDGGSRLTSSYGGPMGDLLLSIEQGREPATSGRRNLATIRHIVAEAESARRGGEWVEL